MTSIGAFSAYSYSPTLVQAPVTGVVSANLTVPAAGVSSRFAPVDEATATAATNSEQGDASASEETSDLEQQKRAQLAAAEAQQLQATQQEIRELAARDREVRTHEQAHMAVGGQYAGAVQYDYDRGPDGRLYAVGGEVGIDTSPIPGDPQATIEKMEQVRRAALAPAEPSGQDRSVAAQAGQAIAQARAELATQGADKAGSVDGPSDEKSASDSTEDADEASPAERGRARDLSLYRDVAASASTTDSVFSLSA
ncbi:putative metalloprotease CJM1_0395 family protein [Halopseudomonas sp.]|uniref:putative metalloprotease CJM1_0395 family protein n=1 Tax=Halopseudomonas sp. TaxID=2901191 RepID=UPI003001DCC5